MINFKKINLKRVVYNTSLELELLELLDELEKHKELAQPPHKRLKKPPKR